MLEAGFATVLRLVGLVLIVYGLWYSAGGMRVVVSGRIDERKRASESLKIGLPLVVLGLAVEFFGDVVGQLGARIDGRICFGGRNESRFPTRASCWSRSASGWSC